MSTTTAPEDVLLELKNRFLTYYLVIEQLRQASADLGVEIPKRRRACQQGSSEALNTDRREELRFWAAAFASTLAELDESRAQLSSSEIAAGDSAKGIEAENIVLDALRDSAAELV